MITTRTLRNLAIIGLMAAGMFLLPKSFLRADVNSCIQQCYAQEAPCFQACQPICMACEGEQSCPQCGNCELACSNALEACVNECEQQ